MAGTKTPQPAPGLAPLPGYNAQQSYVAPQNPTVPGQGTTAVGDPTTANLAVTKTGQKYDDLIVPGSAQANERLAGGDIPTTTYGAPKTLGQMKADLYDLGTSDTNALADLQIQLIKAGLLDPGAKNFALGAVSENDPTDKAYTRLLREAIVNKGDYNVILSSLADKSPRGAAYFDKLQKIQSYQAQQAQQAASGGGQTTSQTFDLTDPNYARLLVNQSLENHLGRKATPDEVNQFYQGLHSAQLSTPGRETDTYGAGGSPFIPKSRVSYSTRPEPGAAADAFALSSQGRANEAGAQSEVGFMSVLQRLLGVNQQGG